ncbi:Smr/MutS family protein [Azospirillum sp. YIM DDC1]|uniref:Smr/MutS family protein n=1 Tax=Azospirillum aestuarii TaxID=2802052 RepID=A0ABS1HWR0_9PROT|nr:Smr/MutS family protein [Azospirillum aestuarii]MBK4718877.1 Smr/MutS family protein [Azospirillum aestuarii]TWA95502.1 DNA-nicking Smr family endonuclease [Azospirillum brasilense]
MNRRRSVSTEERRLWRIAMRDAEPMPGRIVEDPDPPAAPVAEPEPVATTASPPPALPPRGGVPKGGRPSQPPLKVGNLDNIDRRTADRFSRGEMEIDGRIDLHGMSQAQAHGALSGFVHRAWHEGRRCVLVITGKGTYTGGVGVLRQSVPRWLADAALRPMVLAVRPAQPRHGGDGALYVLIKRRRDQHQGWHR